MAEDFMRNGFTLMEVLAVVLIVAVLTAVGMPQYRKSLERAKVAEARQLLPAIHAACERFAVENLCDNWNSGNCASNMGFDTIDTDSKIRYQGGMYRTKNFRYEIIKSGRRVRATFLTGRLTNIMIIYNGNTFSCSAAAGVAPGVRAEACVQMLGFDTSDSFE